MDYTKRCAAALLCLALYCGYARADISYEYVTDQSSYSGAQGSTVTVTLYLQETLTKGSSSLVQSDNGLFGAGVALWTAPTGATSTIGSVTLNQAAVPAGFGTGGGSQDKSNVGGSGATGTSGGSNAALLENVGAGQTTTGVGPTTGSYSSTTNLFKLGTATITVGAGTTTYKVGSYDSNIASNNVNTLASQFGDGQTVTYASTFDLDSTNNASNGGGATYTGADNFVATFVVASVPEPSSMLLCGLAAVGGAYGAYRRRRRQAEIAAAVA